MPLILIWRKTMASPTQQTEKRRRLKEANKGKERKRKVKNQGSTRSEKELFED